MHRNYRSSLLFPSPDQNPFSSATRAKEESTRTIPQAKEESTILPKVLYIRTMNSSHQTEKVCHLIPPPMHVIQQFSIIFLELYSLSSKLSQTRKETTYEVCKRTSARHSQLQTCE